MNKLPRWDQRSWVHVVKSALLCQCACDSIAGWRKEEFTASPSGRWGYSTTYTQWNWSSMHSWNYILVHNLVIYFLKLHAGSRLLNKASVTVSTLSNVPDLAMQESQVQLNSSFVLPEPRLEYLIVADVTRYKMSQTMQQNCTRYRIRGPKFKRHPCFAHTLYTAHNPLSQCLPTLLLCIVDHL